MTPPKHPERRPFIVGLFAWPSDAPRLMASRCPTCDTHSFPKTFTCPNPGCPGTEVEDVELSRTGTLVSYTVVRYRPPEPFRAPDPFEPFAIGEVAFPEGLQVIGPLSGVDIEAVATGIEVETVFDTYHVADDGTEVVGWKFRPVAGESS